jgi:hypothetical protein
MATSNNGKLTASKKAPAKTSGPMPSDAKPSKGGRSNRPERPIADVDRKVRGGDA